MDKEIFDRIHKRIKYIWEEKMKEDYENGCLLKEDTLKNALYHHIRTECSDLFEHHNIRVFTEFTDWKFKGSGYRPDMVLVVVDYDSEEEYLGNRIKECLAVIEIKYLGCNANTDRVYDDYDKLKEYIDNGIDAHLYMVTIWECEDKPTSWLRKNEKWAKGRVTELNASIKRKSDWDPQFYVCEHGERK